MNKPQQNSLSRWLAFFLYSYSRCQDTCNARANRILYKRKGEKSPSGSCLRGESFFLYFIIIIIICVIRDTPISEGKIF